MLEDFFRSAVDLVHDNGGCGVTRVFFRIPLFHVVEDGAARVILDVPLDLIGLVLVGDEQKRTFAAGLDIGAGFVKVVVGDDETLVAVASDAGGIDAVGDIVLVHCGKYDRTDMVVPGGEYGFRYFSHFTFPFK